MYRDIEMPREVNVYGDIEMLREVNVYEDVRCVWGNSMYMYRERVCV